MYLVATTEDSVELPPPCHRAPLLLTALDDLLAQCPVTVDGQPASRTTLADRLAACRLPDEPVVYIGQTGRSVSRRVRAYYRTPLGAKRPHKGGWFVKTLATLEDLWVHYAPAANPKQAEEDLIGAFCAGVSATTKTSISDSELPLPFANLEWRRGERKRHGISGAIAT